MTGYAGAHGRCPFRSSRPHRGRAQAAGRQHSHRYKTARRRVSPRVREQPVRLPARAMERSGLLLSMAVSGFRNARAAVPVEASVDLGARAPDLCKRLVVRCELAASRLRLAQGAYGLAPVKVVLAGDLCKLVPNRRFVERRLSSREPYRGLLGQRLCERASVLGKTGNGGYRLVEDAGSLVGALCPLAEAMNLAVPGRGQVRAGAVRACRGAVRGRRVALPRRTGSRRTPPSPLPSSPVHLRRIHRLCTSLQRSGGGWRSASTSGETGSTNFPRLWATSHRSSSTSSVGISFGPRPLPASLFTLSTISWSWEAAEAECSPPPRSECGCSARFLRWPSSLDSRCRGQGRS